MFVLDASVTLAWCFDDEHTDAGDRVLARLESEEGVAPSIWPLEVANGLRTAERRGRLKASDLPRLRELIGALAVRVEIVELESALGEILDLARDHDLSAYDAAYVALALRRGCSLATVDERLSRACQSAGVPVVG